MNSSSTELDRAAVERVLTGDTEAFEDIVKRWQGPLVNLAWRFCRDRGRAEEMAQEAFLKAYRFLDRWRGEAAFSTWLFAVATNVYRSQMRRYRPTEVALEEAPAVRDRSDPEEDAATNQMASSVRRLVAELPPKYRDALVLFYFMDMKLAAAADVLGVPQGTLKAQLHRARAQLESQLGADPRLPAPEAAQ